MLSSVATNVAYASGRSSGWSLLVVASGTAGARVYFFDRARFRRLLLGLEACERQLAERARNSYAVLREGKVITVGHRESAFCSSKPGNHRFRHGHYRAA